MADVSVTFAVGSEQVTVVLPVDLPTGGETILTGDIGGLVAAGTVARLRGDCRLIDNLHVRGTLLCDPTGVDLDGNGFDIHTHDGTLNLVGVEKTAWTHWGDPVVGWQVGDRLMFSPTSKPFIQSGFTNHVTPIGGIWQGSWAATARPPSAADVTLPDGQIQRPQVANLGQTVTLRNLQRIMIHEASGPNPQTFKWIRVLNSGVTATLAMYPIHFHMIGEHARGSLLEGVVVEGGKNHAFVPHASHGITFTGCAAVNTADDAYWWDGPPPDDATDPINVTNDTNYERCLAMGVVAHRVGTQPGPTSSRLSGFLLTGGDGNKCNNSVSTCVVGGGDSSGFTWPERIGSGGVWQFQNCVAHNNNQDGIFAWQNHGAKDHLIEDFVGYRCGKTAIEHGAYRNFYVYRRCVSYDNVQWGVANHALTTDFGPGTVQPPEELTFEDVVTDGRLRVAPHNHRSHVPTRYRRCVFTGITYGEVGSDWSYNVFEDCTKPGGALLIPSDFLLTVIRPESLIDIVQGGVLVHHWAAGVWS